jgi:hypothetical protein
MNIDSGHSDYISLSTSKDGDHYHQENSYSFHYAKRWASGWITESVVDTTTYKESTSNGEFHSHILSGHSSASISRTGNNEKHENRPPYYVVVYVIFLGSE